MCGAGAGEGTGAGNAKKATLPQAIERGVVGKRVEGPPFFGALFAL